MNNQVYLRHFITEELYPVPEKESPTLTGIADDHSTEDELKSGSKSPSKQKKHLPLLVQCEIGKESERALLGKVLGAIGHNLEETEVIAPKVENHFNPDKMLIFSDQLPEGLSYYQMHQMGDIPTLYSRSLVMLEENIEDKKALWTSLKNWFAING